MKKILSIMLALALVLGLSVVATPVLANVTSATVYVDPPTVNEKASYNITFNITTSLQIGDTASIEFPPDTVVPGTGTYKVNDVWVSDGAIWRAISPGDITVSPVRVVNIRLPIGIGAPGPVTVAFKDTAGITNPTTAGQYTLKVKTSQETAWVTSQEYGMSLPAKSTYQFTYTDPGLISVNVPAEVDVTLRYKVLGQEGYDAAQIEFSRFAGPDTGNVTFEVFDGSSWRSYTNTGSYPPDGGNFTVEEDHNQTIPFKLTFDKVGVYTLNFKLNDVSVSPNVTRVDDKPAFTCAGVSVNVELKKGWNLMSLPIIPTDSTIGTVLAGITGNVTSVWYYDPTIVDPAKKWQSYAPGVGGDLTTMKDGKAYWIDMEEADTLTVVGVAIVPPLELPPSYSVREGWNMVGFKSLDSMNVTDYLEGTEWVRVYKYENGAWKSLAKTDPMQRGLGYWVAFSKAGTIYP